MTYKGIIDIYCVLGFRLLGLLSTYVTRLGSYTLEGIACSPIEALGKLFVFYLGSKAALQKICTAYTIIEWVTLEKVRLIYMAIK